MTGPDTPGSRPVQEDAARRQRESDVYALPAARWPFRITGGAIAAGCVLLLWLKLSAVVRGEVAFLDQLQADFGLLAFCIGFGLALGFIALTGKMPRVVWKLFQRSTKWVD